MRSTSTASRRRRALNPRALDWRYPREVMNPPARLSFNVLQMNSTEKRFRYSSMNRIISDVLGRVPTRKKPRQPSVAHWCRVALDFHGVASRFPRPSLQAQVLGCFPHDGPAGSIDEPCAMKPPTLEQLPGTRLASTCFPPRCGPRQDGPHGPSHPGQIFLACSRFSHLLKRNKTWDTSFGPSSWLAWRSSVVASTQPVALPGSDSTARQR